MQKDKRRPQPGNAAAQFDMSPRTIAAKVGCR
jgi:hypothetical protein